MENISIMVHLAPLRTTFTNQLFQTLVTISTRLTGTQSGLMTRTAVPLA
jgi:hypothetical protein